MPMCPICLGSEKLQDPLYKWVVVECHGCDGTGEMEEKMYNYLMKDNDFSKQSANESQDKHIERQEP